MNNPLQKILPSAGSSKSKKQVKREGGETQPLLGRLLPTTGSKKQHAQHPSREKRLSPHDSVRVWDVKMPPIKSSMVQGKLVPTAGGLVGGRLRQKTSRITIEIHTYKKQQQDRKKREPAKPSQPPVMEGLLRGASVRHAADEEMHEDEYITMRIFRPTASTTKRGLFGFGGREGDHDKEEEEDVNDEDSVSSISLSGVDKEFHDGMWTEAYVYSLDDVVVQKHHWRTVELKVGRGIDTKVRDINFPNEQEAKTFCSILESLVQHEEGRAERRLEAFHASPHGKDWAPGSKVQILIEIVSAVRLPVADVASTDAYVCVHLGREQIHRTKQLPNTLNPVWTIESGSLFLLESSPENFFGTSAGISFTIYDYDAVGKDDILGKVYVPQEELLAGTGERVEYPLILEKQFADAKNARLVLRFRKASSKDIEFMKDFAALKKKKVYGAFANEAFVPIRAKSLGLLKREKRTSKSGVQEFRVKPGPDPARPEETKWMTEKQIDAEAHKPSTSWIRAGSGPLGKLYFEVIGCDGLPNMDAGPLDMVAGGLVQGKTDAYACIIYEDAIVNTDVIMDTLSPRWLPWTQRAFIFNMMHPSSQLILGILDHDARNPLDNDDPIGRITIDHTNMRPMTDYTMQFDLVTSSLVANRKMQGTVTVRMRIEWENERKALLASIKPPPEIYVNMSKARDFDASHYAVIGECDTRFFSMATLTSFVEELQENKAVIPLLRSAVFTVLLWRGHFPVTFLLPTIRPKLALKPVTLKLPIHSMVAFIGGILLAEDYNLFPSFLLFGLGWILLGTLEYQNSHPSPWRRKRSYWEYLQVLLFNRAFTDTIDADEGKEEVEKYLAEVIERETERKREAAEKAARAQKEAEQQEAEEGEVTVETTKEGFGLSLNVLKPILEPVHQNLEIVVAVVRVVKSFVTWEESRYNFWIVNACFTLGFLLVGIPWDFLIHWVFRIVVWTFLGPWMKLVDIFLVKGRSREEMSKAAKQRLHLRYQQLVEARRGRQIKREDALKLQSMKRYMYGSYIVRVPRFKEYRFYDWPLYASHASPHVGTSTPNVSATFHGQHLEGHMIPEREEPEGELFEEKADEQKHPDEKSNLTGGTAQKYGTTG